MTAARSWLPLVFSGCVDCGGCKHPPTIGPVSSDDDGDSDGKPKEREIPPTRRHESVAEPARGTRIDVPMGAALGGALVMVGVVFTGIALRADAFDGIGMLFGLGPVVAGVALLAMNLKRVRTVPEEVPTGPVDPLHATVTYPDDDKLAAVVRSSDAMIGKFEQVVLVALLFSVMMIAVISTLSDKIANAHPFGHFKDDAIRGGTFAMALLGAAFAMHQGRHLSMDLISRRLKPRARLFLKVVLALFTIGAVLLMVRSGFHTIIKEAEFKAEDKLITPLRLAYLVPIGGAMIIVHTALHTIIDLNYIFRRKTPPEKMRTGH